MNLLKVLAVKPNSQELPQTVVILRFSAAGDVILTAPALAALAHAWPHSRLVFVTHARFAPLMQHNPHIHTVLGVKPKESLSLWGRRLQQVLLGSCALLDLHGKLRGRILRWCMPWQRQVVWQKRALWQTLAVYMGDARYQATMPIVTRYHQAVERLVGRALPQVPLRYYVDPTALEEARRLVEHLKPAYTRRPKVAMAPGAAWFTKCWPAERFAALARWLDLQGYHVLLTGSPEETALCQKIAQEAPGATVLAGSLDLRLLGGVLQASRAFVGNDSAPLHMARGLALPTLAIFGPTDPNQFDFGAHELLYAGVDCAPCSFYGHRQCPRGHHDCMQHVSVRQVQAAFEQLLQKKTTQSFLK